MDYIINSPRHIGQILRTRRRARKLSQQVLAEKLDLSQNRLSEIEARPEDLTVQRLLAMLNLLGLELTIRDKAGRPSSKASSTLEW